MVLHLYRQAILLSFFSAESWFKFYAYNPILSFNSIIIIPFSYWLYQHLILLLTLSASHSPIDFIGIAFSYWLCRHLILLLTLYASHSPIDFIGIVFPYGLYKHCLLVAKWSAPVSFFWSLLLTAIYFIYIWTQIY